jgi:hypothetical protein
MFREWSETEGPFNGGANYCSLYLHSEFEHAYFAVLEFRSTSSAPHSGHLRFTGLYQKTCLQSG